MGDLKEARKKFSEMPRKHDLCDILEDDCDIEFSIELMGYPYHSLADRLESLYNDQVLYSRPAAERFLLHVKRKSKRTACQVLSGQKTENVTICLWQIPRRKAKPRKGL